MTLSFALPSVRELGHAWFGPMPADRLAVLRILTGSFALWYLVSRFGMFADIAATSPTLYEPVGLAALFPTPLPAAVVPPLVALTVALGAAFVLGWRFRWVGPLFAALFLFVMCYRNSWSMIYHSRNLVVLSVLVLGLAPSADALSLDALRGAAHRARTWLWARARHRDADAAYGWPVRLIVAVTAAAYFIAGLAKVAGEAGFGWATGTVLLDQILVDALRKDVLQAGSLPPLTAMLIDHTWLFTVLATGSLVLELGAPLLVLHRRLGMAWAGLAWGMHWGIFFMMSIRFHYQMAGLAFAPLFPVEVPVRWVRSRLGYPPTGWATAPRAVAAPLTEPELV